MGKKAAAIFSGSVPVSSTDGRAVSFRATEGERYSIAEIGLAAKHPAALAATVGVRSVDFDGQPRSSSRDCSGLARS